MQGNDQNPKLPTGLIVFSLIAVLAAILFVRLGLWQLERHVERRDESEQRAERLAMPAMPLDSLLWSIGAGAMASDAALPWRRVTLSGQWRARSDALIRNRAHRGRAGVHVVTPLRLPPGRSSDPASERPGGRHEILVLRGWLPALDATTPSTPVAETEPPGDERGAEAAIRLSRDGAGAPVIRVAAGENSLPSLAAVDVERIWSELGATDIGTGRVTGVFLQLLPTAGPSGSVRGGTPIPAALPEPGNGPHLVYAVQWFSFALVALGGAYFFVRQRRRELSAATRASRRSP